MRQGEFLEVDTVIRLDNLFQDHPGYFYCKGHEYHKLPLNLVIKQ